MDKLRLVGSAINALGRLSPKRAGRLALLLFTRPRRAPLDPHLAAYLDAGERLALDFGEGLVGYRFPPRAPEQPQRQAPRGPRVLLLHGWESHAGRWVPLVERLRARGCTCTALDGPAAGRSGGTTTPFNYYVAAAVAFERAYGPFDAMVGHSLGGGVAAQLCLRTPPPRRPRRAVLLASFDESEHVFARYRAMMGYAPHVGQAYAAAIEELVERLTPGTTVADYSPAAAARRLSDVSALIVHSRDDAICPFAEGERLHLAWPGSRFLPLVGAGHRLQRADVLAAVTSFLAGEHPPRDGAR